MEPLSPIEVAEQTGQQGIINLLVAAGAKRPSCLLGGGVLASLFLVVRPGAPSSVLAPSSDARSS